MKKLAIALAAASAVIALAEPSFAASRGRHATQDRDAAAAQADPYWNGPGYEAFARDTDGRANRTGAAGTPRLNGGVRTTQDPVLYGRNFPYPDRPYGAPDNW